MRFAYISDVDFTSRLADYILQMQPARDLLTKINFKLTRSKGFNFYRLKFFQYPVSWRHVRFHFTFGCFSYDDPLPFAVIKTRSAPTWLLPPGVIMLPVIYQV